MDPDANLREQLEISKRITMGREEEGDSDRLAELVQSLNRWITDGGFLPKAWQQERPGT